MLYEVITLLADEINRAPAKVQSALLEVMQERQAAYSAVWKILVRSRGLLSSCQVSMPMRPGAAAAMNGACSYNFV